MGQAISFIGALTFNRELTHKEWLELTDLSHEVSSRNHLYTKYTDTPETIPEGYLQWEPNNSGTEFRWNGAKGFHNYIHWLRWIIKHYMKPHELVLNGQVLWQGEEISDAGMMNVIDNKVTYQKITVPVHQCPNCGHIFRHEN